MTLGRNSMTSICAICCIVIAASFLVSSSRAQPVNEQPISEAGQQAQAGQASQRLSSSLPPRNCDAYLDPNAKVPTPPTVTLISIRLSDAGQIGDSAIFKSSGDVGLDNAVLACIKGHVVRPILVDGKPTNATTMLGYFRWPHRSFFADPTPNALPNICSGYYPTDALRLHEQGVALIFAEVASDGTVKSVVLAQTTNSSQLDHASLDCVHKFRFFPIIRDGKPVETEHIFQVAWRIE
ncbi:MAG TPA: energy transducer TonB [Rhizomicrobium sp.]